MSLDKNNNKEMINSNLMVGKNVIVTGVANNMSIAWAIAKILKANGANIALTYQGEVLKKRVYPLAEQINCDFVQECDVTNESSIDKLFSEISSRWGVLDGMLHAIAFSEKSELSGRYINTSAANFSNSMLISCYSLVSLARNAEPLMKNGGSILTLTYYGSQKVMPSYNVMGVAKAALETSVKYLANDMGPNNIRVNAMSPGPIRTLASSAIKQFSDMHKTHGLASPLKRNTTLEDVANSALYLLSDLSSGVTGEVHYVDSGYNVMGSFGSSLSEYTKKEIEV